MGNKLIKYLFGIFFIFSLMFIAFTVIYGGTKFTVSKFVHFNDEPRYLSDKWYYTEDNRRINIEKLPARLDTGNFDDITIQRLLPEIMPNAGVIFLETYHQAIQVWINSTLIYEYGLNNHVPIGNILGSVSHTIDLPDDAEGKMLTIRLSSSYSLGVWHISPITLGSAGAVMRVLVKSCVNTAIFVLLFGALGIIIIIIPISFYNKLQNFNIKGFIYLGCFFLLSVIWVLTDSRLGQYVITNHVAIYLLSFFSFTLMSVPFLLFLKQITSYGKCLINIITTLHFLQLFSSIWLYFSGVADLIATLPITHILMVITILMTFFICIRDLCLHHEKNILYIAIGIGILALGSFTALFTYTPGMSRDNSQFFIYGLIGFFLLLGYGAIKYSLKLVHDSMKTEIYKNIAFTDALTGLPNRTAFDAEIRRLELDNIDTLYTLIVMDINGLKPINDTYGHQIGDLMIFGAGRCIETIFSQHATYYRIGGDEFIALLPSDNKAEAEELLRKLDIETAQYDMKISKKLSLAKGFASGKIGSPKMVRLLIQEADEKMYEEKRNRFSENIDNK